MDLKLKDNTDISDIRFEYDDDGELWVRGLPEVTADNLPEPEQVNTVARFRVGTNEYVAIKANNDSGENWRYTSAGSDRGSMISWQGIKGAAVKGTLRTFSPAPAPKPTVSDTAAVGVTGGTVQSSQVTFESSAASPF